MFKNKFLEILMSGTPSASRTSTPRSEDEKGSKIGEDEVTFDAEYVTVLKSRLLECAHGIMNGRKRSKGIPANEVMKLVAAAETSFIQDPLVIDVKGETRAHVFGDIHGQFFDLVHMLDITGGPRKGGPMFVFSGDYVDRGAWGVEVLLLLLALKLAFPQYVILLRGNHESRNVAHSYGFYHEAVRKVGAPAANKILQMFSSMPLACLIRDCLVVHGGPWRSNLRIGEPGTLEELRSRPRLHSSLGIEDPMCLDAMWSDPMPSGKWERNFHRGVGICYGPDFTEEFLKINNLRLVLRAHEGPDARAMRPGMASIDAGFCVDHSIPGVGSLMTLFSAPDFDNQTLGAFATLDPPNFDEVHFSSFGAMTRRKGS